MSKECFKNNLKVLRKYYHETMEDLAYSIGQNSISTISQYENGERFPKHETLELIAKHYGITVDTLININLTSGVELNFSKETNLDFFKTVFPLFESDNALKNRNFAIAFKAHNRIMEYIYTGQELNDRDFDVCYENYQKAIEVGVIEALLNIICCHLIIDFAYHNCHIIEKYNDLSNKEMNSQSILKFLLYDVYDESIKENSYDLEVVKENDEVLMGLLKNLKKLKKYDDLVYYFIAVKYLFCFVNNRESNEVNKSNGMEMMSLLRMFENKYALDFFNSIDKLVK